jgi:phage gp45-like
MGIIATLLQLEQGKIDELEKAPGPSILAQGEGFDGRSIIAEVYQAPGVAAIPGDGVRGVWVPVGGSRRYGVVVAVHNYAVEFDLEKGEAMLYSTNDAGDEIKASVKLGADGSIQAENENGFFSLESDGKFSANGNLEVDP